MRRLSLADNWFTVVKNGSTDTGNTLRREAIRAERAALATEMWRLRAIDEQLVREDEQLRQQAESLALEPHTVNARWLMAKLSLSSSSFWRLVNNKAKGFPTPIYGLTSDPQFIWPKVKLWVEELGRTQR